MGIGGLRWLYSEQERRDTSLSQVERRVNSSHPGFHQAHAQLNYLGALTFLSPFCGCEQGAGSSDSSYTGFWRDMMRCKTLGSSDLHVLCMALKTVEGTNVSPVKAYLLDSWLDALGRKGAPNVWALKVR